MVSSGSVIVRHQFGRFGFALEPFLALAGILALTPFERLEHVLLAAPIVLLELSRIARLAVDLDQPAVRVVRRLASLPTPAVGRAHAE